MHKDADVSLPPLTHY